MYFTINQTGDPRDALRAHLEESDPNVIFIDQGENEDALILSPYEARKLARILVKLADAADVELA